MDLSKLTLGDKIIGGTAIVLIIDLLFFPWHSVKLGGGAFSVNYTRSGIESPGSLWGILALLLAIAVLAVVIIRKMTSTKLPDVPRPWGELIFYATIAILVLLLLKLVLKTDYLGFGSYFGILLAAGMVYGGFLGRSDADARSTGSGPNTPF